MSPRQQQSSCYTKAANANPRLEALPLCALNDTQNGGGAGALAHRVAVAPFEPPSPDAAAAAEQDWPHW